MSSDLTLGGVYVPLITPFAADGSVAVEEIRRLGNESLDAGARGLLALGTTGEPATLSEPEKQLVIDAVGSVCRQRNAEFVIGAGSNTTEGSVQAVRDASKVEGVTALLTVVPYYTRPSEVGIVEHFRVLAQESSVPLMLYNIPYRTGRGLGAASLLELASTPNIAGLKQAVGGIDQDTLTLMANKPDDFHVLCGDDPFLYSLLALGASGAVAASAHVCTEMFVSMIDDAAAGGLGRARFTSEKLLGVTQALFAEPAPSVVKGALAKMGRISTPSLRLPMTAASPQSIDTAVAAIAAATR